MSLVEQAARSLHLCDEPTAEWGDLTAARRHQYMFRVSTVLASLREPSDPTGNRLRKLPRERYRPGSHSATEIWQAMIDGALDGD